MNAFDYHLLLALNQLADWSPLLTTVVVGIYGDMLKSALIVALIWWAWFANEGSARQIEARERIAACLVASLVCIVAIRLCAVALPFRVRPIANPSLGLHFPIVAGSWGNWSAFPSDNAVLFSMLATCLFFISRPLGLIAALDVALLICFPRVFVGVHHPSDVIVGALIGVWLGWFVGRDKIRIPLSAPAIAVMRRHPAAFYATAFLVTFLFAQVFWPLTSLAISTTNFVRALANL